MVKILFGTAAVAMIVAGSYAMLAASARKTEKAETAAAETEESNDEWRVEYYDMNKNPIKPVNVKSNPASGFQWKTPSNNSPRGASQSGKGSTGSKCTPDKSTGLKPAG